MKMRAFLACAVLAGMAFALANPVMADACGSCHTENTNAQYDLVTVVNTDTSSNTVNLAPADALRVNTDNDLQAPAFGAETLTVSTNGAAAADTAATWRSLFGSTPGTANATLTYTTANAASGTPSSEVGGPGSSGDSLGAPAPTPDERLSLVT